MNRVPLGYGLRVRWLAAVLLLGLFGCGEPLAGSFAGVAVDDSALPTDDTPIAPSGDASALQPDAEPPWWLMHNRNPGGSECGCATAMA